MKTIFLSFFLVTTSSILCALDQIHSIAANEDYVLILLSGYLDNDIALKELFLNAQKARIESGKTGIQNGIGIDLSTGQLLISGTEDTGASFKVSPQAKVSAPQINNSSISVAAETSGNRDEFNTYNVAVSLSTAIISSATRKSRLAQLQAERAVKEAELALKNRTMEAEQDFYKQLAAIFSDAVSMLTLQDDVYTKEIELETVKLQGFTENSIRFRTVLLEVQGKRRDSELAKRELTIKMYDFLEDCGIHWKNLIDDKGFGFEPSLDLMPQSIPVPALLDTLPYFEEQNPDSFKNFESAVWAHHIGKLSREASGELELNALGGFTLNNTNFDKTASVNAGLSLAYKGITATGGTEIPIGSGKKPAFTFSLGLKLNDHRIAALEKQLKQLNNEAELLAINKAQKVWRQTALSMSKTREDLVWEKKENAEHLELYKLLEADTVTFYKQGLINESGYKNAISNTLRARYQCILTDIKIVQYLIEYQLCFVDFDFSAFRIED
ncbi:MAG: hypothetical protein Ta2B_11540 [Termitinemataceae bacterium]|nr:MAG: hypothetical protein Ta2B_11540 [Termitinemataceae bacterium]